MTFFCDCMLAIEAMNKCNSPSHALLFAIRTLCFIAHTSGFVFRFRWLSTKDNAFADALSRLDFTRFYSLCASQGLSVEPRPCIPASLPRGPYESMP